MQQAREGLTKKRDTVHRWFLEAFEYRIQQTLDGTADHERLDPSLLERLEQMERFDRYKVDRLRQHSRILEPHEKIDPYRKWRRYSDDLNEALSTLSDVADGEELKRRIGALLTRAAVDGGGTAREAWVLATALELAPRLGESFAVGLLERVPPLLDRSSDAADQQRVLEKGLFVAGHFNQTRYVNAFVRRIYEVLQRQDLTRAGDALESLLTECYRGLRKLGMRDEIARLLRGIAELVRGRQEGGSLNLLLLVASGWFYFGEDKSAGGVLEEAREVLFGSDLKPVEQTKLACAYVGTLGHAPIETALPRLEEMFSFRKTSQNKPVRRLARIQDSFTTTSHFSLSQLDVTEAVVFALVGDVSGGDSQSRRWLDEDEFLIRRRIHADVNTAMNQTGF